MAAAAALAPDDKATFAPNVLLDGRAGVVPVDGTRTREYDVHQGRFSQTDRVILMASVEQLPLPLEDDRPPDAYTVEQWREQWREVRSGWWAYALFGLLAEPLTLGLYSLVLFTRWQRADEQRTFGKRLLTALAMTLLLIVPFLWLWPARWSRNWYVAYRSTQSRRPGAWVNLISSVPWLRDRVIDLRAETSNPEGTAAATVDVQKRSRLIPATLAVATLVAAGSLAVLAFNSFRTNSDASNCESYEQALQAALGAPMFTGPIVGLDNTDQQEMARARLAFQGAWAVSDSTARQLLLDVWDRWADQWSAGRLVARGC